MTESLRLRAGRSVGRTLYQVSADGTEKLIGMVDTPELATLIITAVNSASDPAAGECLRDQLVEYLRVCQAQHDRGRLAEKTRKTYTLHATNFVRWTEGTFHPGEGR
jgi:hypothetical protein